MRMALVSVKRCRAGDIFDDPSYTVLKDEYARECSIPDANPLREMYEVMENAKALDCFGAYVEGKLVGFITVIQTLTPHHGKRVATVESFFVASAHRSAGLSRSLLEAAKACAKEAGCVKLLYTARTGSRFSTVLSRRPGCVLTHVQFTESL